MWMDGEELAEELHAVLQRASGTPGTLKAFWTPLARAAAIAAYWEIVNALMARGWSKEKVDQWDRGPEYQRAIGLWWCLEQGKSMEPESYNSAALDEYKLDRRWELRDTDKGPGVLLTIAGVFVPPDTTLGQPTTGGFNTSNDLFVMDPCDSRRGQVTRL